MEDPLDSNVSRGAHDREVVKRTRPDNRFAFGGSRCLALGVLGLRPRRLPPHHGRLLWFPPRLETRCLMHHRGEKLLTSNIKNVALSLPSVPGRPSTDDVGDKAPPS